MAFTSYGGREINVSGQPFEVLTGTGFEWTRDMWEHGQVPSNAVEGGKTARGEILYIGRTVHEDSVTPGKIQPSLGCLYIPYGCEEYRYMTYQVLTWNGVKSTVQITSDDGSTPVESEAESEISFLALSELNFDETPRNVAKRTENTEENEDFIEEIVRPKFTCCFCIKFGGGSVKKIRKRSANGNKNIDL